MTGRGRPCIRGTRDDDGSAVVEFVSLGMLMLLPVVYLVVTLGRVQAAAYGADAAARSAVRALTVADTEADGRAAALAGVRLALQDQGFDADARQALTIGCDPSGCLTPGALVTTAVSVDVVLPGVPAFVDGLVPTHVPVTAHAVARVETVRAAP